MSILLKIFPLLIRLGGFFVARLMNQAFSFYLVGDYAKLFEPKGVKAVCIEVLLLQCSTDRVELPKERENWNAEWVGRFLVYCASIFER